ncbi:recombination protein RecR [Alphaproteobacteria bacterium]|nr:recombination protein RecR [Alphaproteobacteria bacterium]GHT00054.1 recombination protein RecR [Alphaproteobacteria bacterium]
MTAPLSQLIQTFSKLPGFGPRLAQRTVLHLLKNDHILLDRLLEDLAKVKEKVQKCSLCGNFDHQNPCTLCSSPERDASQLCIVETVSDLWALERARFFSGHYHVLGGVLSAVDGVGPSQLHLKNIATRLQDEGITEIILALSATLEGQATMFYLMDFFAPFSVKISSLAQGMPMGGELNYLDDATLSTAFTGHHLLTQTLPQLSEPTPCDPTFAPIVASVVKKAS